MTREEAIKCLTVEVGLRSSGYCDYLARGGKQDVDEEDFLDALYSAIDALKEQPRWIPVEERLPDNDQGYFIVWSGSCNYAGEAVWDGYTFRWIANDNNACATHWMPLPEPPEVPHE